MSAQGYLGKIKKTIWRERWAGSYTFISCSYWGPQYFFSLQKVLRISFSRVLFLHHQGTVRFFVSDRDLRSFGSKLARRASNDINFVKDLCGKLKQNTDILLPLLKSNKGKIPTVREYKKFLTYFDRHLAYHNFVKKTVDFLPGETLNKLLPYFQDARKYSETVYSESEIFFRKIAGTIAGKRAYPARLLTCLTQKEFESFLREGLLPDKSALSARYRDSVLYFDKGQEVVLSGGAAIGVKAVIDRQLLAKKSRLTGVSAYPGRIRARVRVILDPNKKQIFHQGDILVTGMTRPEFMPYIRKASAIVTDIGGILCHAAITARELKKPCVIGVNVATKFLKSGLQVEVDANRGIIRLL